MRLLGVIDTVVIDTFGPEIVDASEPVEPSFEIQTGSAQIVLKGEDAYGSRKLVLESSDELHVTFVCDGHGGAAAAQLCADKLLPILIEEARGDGSTASLQRAATRACARLHAEARAASTAGSTLTCIIVHPGRREVTAFNLGDSVASSRHIDTAPSSYRIRSSRICCIWTVLGNESVKNEPRMIRRRGWFPETAPPPPSSPRCTAPPTRPQGRRLLLHLTITNRCAAQRALRDRCMS